MARCWEEMCTRAPEAPQEDSKDQEELNGKDSLKIWVMIGVIHDLSENTFAFKNMLPPLTRGPRGSDTTKIGWG